MSLFDLANFNNLVMTLIFGIISELARNIAKALIKMGKKSNDLIC